MTNPNLLDCLKKGERRTAWQERECSVFELLGRVDNPIHTMIKTYAAVAAVAAMFQDWKHTAPMKILENRVSINCFKTRLIPPAFINHMRLYITYITSHLLHPFISHQIWPHHLQV